MVRANKIRYFIFFCLLTLSAACENPKHFEGRYVTGIDYPKRNILLIIPFGQGSSSDQFSRHFAAILSRELPVIVHSVNIEGAGGLVGMIEATRKAPDGYTILEITPSHIISDVLNRNEIQLRKHFDPLTMIQKDYYLLLSGKRKLGYSLQSILGHKKSSFTIGGISPQGLDEMTMHALAEAFDVAFTFIPYRSGQELRAAAFSGEVDFILGKMIANLKYIRSGQLKAELLLNCTRLTNIPEVAQVPSIGELGLDVEIQSWRGFAVRKGIPKHIRDYLVERIRYVYESKAYQEYMTKSLGGASHEGFVGPKKFAAFWENQYRFFGNLQKK